jgi:osmotically-inducible protein OsmY
MTDSNRIPLVPVTGRKAQIKPSRQSDIVRRIHAALEKETRINVHRFPISVSFDHGNLVLAGEAKHIAAKKLILEVAANVAPTAGIVDRVRVVPAESMSDREIRDHVIKMLLEEPALEHCLIHSRLPKSLESHRTTIPEPVGTLVVSVSDGVVTLNGEVPSLSHKRLAGVLAWWVPGCRDVVNGLEEVPPEEDNDDELTDAVRLVLEKDPFVNAAKIHVTSKDWIVTLDGVVPNDTMKQMAERDVWYILGVKEVVNHMQVQG